MGILQYRFVKQGEGELQAIERLGCENEQLKEAAKALVKKLEEIHQDKPFQSVWVMAKIHGYDYTGPTYEDELKQLKQCLDK